MLRAFKTIILSLFLLLSSCSLNLYNDLTAKTSDDALYIDAKKKMDVLDWDGAITKFQAMSASTLQRRDVARNYAGALAGKCGLDFMDFVNNELPAVGVGNLFNVLMAAYQGKTFAVNVTGVTEPTATTDTYCSWAQQIMDDVQTNYGAWNDDEKYFVVVLSLAKIGILLRNYADADDDGSVDGTFDACDGTTVIKDFYVKQIATGLALVISNSSGILAGGGAALISDIQTFCTANNLGFCGDVAPASVDATDIKNMRGLIMMDPSSILLTGISVNTATQGVPANSTPSTGNWSCTGLGALPGPPGTLGCCP